MSSACTPILVGVVSSVSEIKISLWSTKVENFNRSESAQKIFMQLGVDVTCMHTSFGGCDPFRFGDMGTLQKQPNFPFGAWTIVHGHGKIQSIRIGSKNLCM